MFSKWKIRLGILLVLIMVITLMPFKMISKEVYAEEIVQMENQIQSGNSVRLVLNNVGWVTKYDITIYEVSKKGNTMLYYENSIIDNSEAPKKSIVDVSNLNFKEDTVKFIIYMSTSVAILKTEILKTDIGKIINLSMDSSYINLRLSIPFLSDKFKITSVRLYSNEQDKDSCGGTSYFDVGFHHDGADLFNNIRIPEGKYNIDIHIEDEGNIYILEKDEVQLSNTNNSISFLKEDVAGVKISFNNTSNKNINIEYISFDADRDRGEFRSGQTETATWLEKFDIKNNCIYLNKGKYKGICLRTTCEDINYNYSIINSNILDIFDDKTINFDTNIKAKINCEKGMSDKEIPVNISDSFNNSVMIKLGSYNSYDLDRDFIPILELKNKDEVRIVNNYQTTGYYAFSLPNDITGTFDAVVRIRGNEKLPIPIVPATSKINIFPFNSEVPDIENFKNTIILNKNENKSINGIIDLSHYYEDGFKRISVCIRDYYDDKEHIGLINSKDLNNDNKPFDLSEFKIDTSDNAKTIEGLPSPLRIPGTYIMEIWAKTEKIPDPKVPIGIITIIVKDDTTNNNLMKLNNLCNSFDIYKGTSKSPTGLITSKDNITKVTLGVVGFYDDTQKIGLIDTRNFTGEKKTFDLSDFVLSASDEAKTSEGVPSPFRTPGTYTIKIWVKTEKDTNPKEALGTFTVNVKDALKKLSTPKIIQPISSMVSADSDFIEWNDIKDAVAYRCTIIDITNSQDSSNIAMSARYVYNPNLLLSRGDMNLEANHKYKLILETYDKPEFDK